MNFFLEQTQSNRKYSSKAILHSVCFNSKLKHHHTLLYRSPRHLNDDRVFLRQLAQFCIHSPSRLRCSSNILLMTLSKRYRRTYKCHQKPLIKKQSVHFNPVSLCKWLLFDAKTKLFAFIIFIITSNIKSQKLEMFCLDRDRAFDNS